MIVVGFKSHGFGYSQKWFARRTKALDALRIVAYYQFLGKRPALFFIRRSFSTVVIDLQRDPEAILGDMHHNQVRAKIRRAEREGLVWQKNVDPVEFAEFHNRFAREKGILGVDAIRLKLFGNAVLLTRAMREEEVLAQHAHLVDPVEGRARLLYSSSGRYEGSDPALVGRANRWCHWKDMLDFREAGIRTYDLGGIAEGAADPAVAGINEFKLHFGGAIAREDHWLSPLYWLASSMGAR